MRTVRLNYRVRLFSRLFGEQTNLLSRAGGNPAQRLLFLRDISSVVGLAGLTDGNQCFQQLLNGVRFRSAELLCQLTRIDRTILFM